MTAEQIKNAIIRAGKLFPCDSAEKIGVFGQMLGPRHDPEIVLGVLTDHSRENDFLKLPKIEEEIRRAHRHLDPPARPGPSPAVLVYRDWEQKAREDFEMIDGILSDFSLDELNRMKHELIAELSAGNESEKFQAKVISRSDVRSGKILRTLLASRIQKASHLAGCHR